jgi:hypothetical protein
MSQKTIILRKGGVGLYQWPFIRTLDDSICSTDDNQAISTGNINHSSLLERSRPHTIVRRSHNNWPVFKDAFQVTENITQLETTTIATNTTEDCLLPQECDRSDDEEKNKEESCVVLSSEKGLDPLYPGSQHTVYQLALRISNIKSLFPGKATSSLMGLVLQAFEDVLPQGNKVSYLLNKGSSESSRGSADFKRIRSMISRCAFDNHPEEKKGSSFNPRTIEIDVCVNGCTLYYGRNSDLMSCENCKEFRFEPCTYQECGNMVPDPGRICPHDFTRRISRRKAYYAPLADRLRKLIDDPVLGKYFLYPDHLKRNPVKFIKGPEGIRDICEGNEYTRIKEAVEVNSAGIRSEWTIGLAIAYDGFRAVKKWNQKSIWAMWCFVLDLPPKLRNVPGIGMHLVLLHDITKGHAEKCLVRATIVQELKRLSNEGVCVSQVPCFKERSNAPKVIKKDGILRAFVSYFHLDTRGLEKMLCIQGANSTAGCYRCDSFQSTRIKGIDKALFLGHRRFLPTNDPRRKFCSSNVRRDDPELVALHFVEEEKRMRPKEMTYVKYIDYSRQAKELNFEANSKKRKRRRKGKNKDY